MACRLGLVAGLLFLAAANLRAGDGPNPKDLVRQLGSEKFAARDTATKALDRLGASALPYLIEASRHPDFETRRRADLLYQKIQDRLLAADLFKPRPIRWQFTDQPLRRVLDDINAATGLSLSCDPDHAQQRITVDTGSAPLWQALDVFYRKSGWAEPAELPATWYMDAITGPSPPSFILGGYPAGAYSVHRAMRLKKVKVADFPLDIQGPFRLRALPLSLHQGGWNRKLTQSLWFLLEVRVDPKVGLLTLDSLTVTSLTDGHGKPVKVPPTLNVPAEQQPIHGQENVDAHVSRTGYFILPVGPGPEKAGAWSEVKGSIAARVRVQQPFVEIKDLAKSIGQPVTGPYGLELKVLDAEVLDGGDLQVRVRLDNLDAFKEAAAQPQVVRVRPGFVALRGPADIAADHVVVMDAKGRALVRRSCVSKPTPDIPQAVDLQLTIQGPIDAIAGIRLELAAPRILRVDVPFVLRNKQ